jgi:hypothetical protein
MIEYCHKHLLRPMRIDDRDDGTRVIHSKCFGSPFHEDPTQMCLLEEERTFRHGDGVPIRIRYRFAGIWFAATDLLRLLPIPVEMCSTCDGNDDTTLGTCPNCAGLGVCEPNGRPIRQPQISSV